MVFSLEESAMKDYNQVLIEWVNWMQLPSFPHSDSIFKFWFNYSTSNRESKWSFEENYTNNLDFSYATGCMLSEKNVNYPNIFLCYRFAPWFFKNGILFTLELKRPLKMDGAKCGPFKISWCKKLDLKLEVVKFWFWNLGDAKCNWENLRTVL